MPERQSWEAGHGGAVCGQWKQGASDSGRLACLGEEAGPSGSWTSPRVTLRDTSGFEFCCEGCRTVHLVLPVTDATAGQTDEKEM